MSGPELKFEQQPRRRLTMADLGIIVAASAIGLALGRYLDGLVEEPSIGFAILTGWKRSIVWADAAIIAATLGLLSVRFLPPRPKFREALRQPGTLALIMTTANWLGYSVLIMGRTAFNHWQGNGQDYAIISILYMIGSAGIVVALVWGTLVAVGVWRPVPDWVDRSSRGFGVIVITYYFVFSIIM